MICTLYEILWQQGTKQGTNARLRHLVLANQIIRGISSAMFESRLTLGKYTTACFGQRFTNAVATNRPFRLDPSSPDPPPQITAGKTLALKRQSVFLLYLERKTTPLENVKIS